MYLDNFNLSATSPQEVTGMLKATGSTDPDVLYARKADFKRNFNTQKNVGLLLLIVGAVSCLTVVLIPVGGPAAIFGWWLWNRGKRNLAIVEGTFAQYMAALPAGARSAIA